MANWGCPDAAERMRVSHCRPVKMRSKKGSVNRMVTCCRCQRVTMSRGCPDAAAGQMARLNRSNCC